jgi:hypothetical protein
MTGAISASTFAAATAAARSTATTTAATTPVPVDQGPPSTSGDVPNTDVHVPLPRPTGNSSTDDAKDGAHAANGKHKRNDGVRQDFASNAFRASSWLGLGGAFLDWGRWGAAYKFNKARGTLGLWAYSPMPIIGPGINNKVVPYEHGAWKTAYTVSNSFGTVMSAVHLAVALPNLGMGFKQGWDSDDPNHGVGSHALHGLEGLVATRAGRTGLIAGVGPAITWGIILGAGWHARSEGALAVLRAGQQSPLRGSMALGFIGVALTPFLYMNESGSLDFLNLDRDPEDHRSSSDVFFSGLHRIPEAVRSLSLPFLPKAWVPQAPGDDASAG